MAAPTRIPVVLALAIVLAGCSTDADPSEAAPGLATAAEENASRAALPDGRGEAAAFNETNVTEAGVGGEAHAHDYWQARERVNVLDERPLLSLCCLPEPAVSSSVLAPIEGALVFEGTGHLEITLSEPQRVVCTSIWLFGSRLCGDAVPLDDPRTGPSGLRLVVRDARSVVTNVTDLSWGEPYLFPIDDPRATDMPHSLWSTWSFRLEGDDETLHGLRARIVVDALRAPEGTIPPWPGHPDLYAAGPDRLVLDKSDATTRENGVMTAIEDPASLSYHAPDKIVSWGTRAVHVFVNITDIRTANPALAPGQWELVVKNASGRQAVLDPLPGDTRELYWALPVDDAGMDNPYAVESRWGFLLRGIFHLGADDEFYASCTGACVNYEVTYHLTVLASATPLPDADEA